MHTAMLYSDEDEYVSGLAGFIGSAPASGARVVVAVPKLGLKRLRKGLGADLEHVRLLDMTALGSNPARIIPLIQAAIDAYPGHSLYVVAEPVWAERSDEEICEAMQHEALINRAFASADIRILCPYEVSALADEVVADVERTHRWLCNGDGRRPSEVFDARALPASAEAPLPDPPGKATSLRFKLGDLARMRSLVNEQAARARLSGSRRGDVVLAASEVAANSIRHGGGEGTLRTWQQHARLICEISDAGHIHDPLAGRVRPTPHAGGGRGLWLANQLCDLVQIRTGRGGTTVRLHARRYAVQGQNEPALMAAQA
jgi:anti-sigma regulatory factor (Ser/Thr protein kinase)